MFDDPKKELRRLQEELLAAEEEDMVADDLSDIEDLLEEYTTEDEGYEACFEENYEDEYDQYRREPLYRNYSNGYGAQVRNFANGYGRGQEMPEEEELDEDSVLYKDDYVQSRKKPKEKGVRGLVFLAVLEIIAIIAILVRWALWLI